MSRKYPYNNTVCLTSKVQLFGTEYAEGIVVSAGQFYGQPEFFMIVRIIAIADKVSFLSKKLTAWYFEHYWSFQVEYSDYSEVVIIEIADLNHYLPLTVYSVRGKLWVTLRTHLC